MTMDDPHALLVRTASRLAEITVKVHVSALFRILGVVNRTQAVVVARRMGMEHGGDDGLKPPL